MSQLQLQIPAHELVNFALPVWYPSLHQITIKSKFIELTQSFVDYLTSDGIILPQGCQLPSIQQEEEEEEAEWAREWDEHTPCPPARTSPLPPPPPPSFPDLLPHISAAISALGGKGVIPKLNWSAPKDAVWISVTNSLCCTSPAEVILLLKSSDFIAHDISRVSEVNASSHQAQAPLQCTLCLREWKEMHPSSEFRCFVRDSQVIGACQRDCTTHYPFLLPMREQLLQELVSFHFSQLRGKVSPQTPNSYVFDVYREKEGEFMLIDLNPFCTLTDPLLYSWEELGAWQGGAELRLVGVGCIQPSEHQAYRLPKDIVDLSTGEDINKFVDLFPSNALGKS